MPDVDQYMVEDCEKMDRASFIAIVVAVVKKKEL
jgi:hypothetical protein